MISKRVTIQCDACGNSESMDELDLETSEKWHEAHRLTADGEKKNTHHFCTPCFKKMRLIIDELFENLAKHVREYK